MTTHEERMCELQAEIFERSASRFSCSSSLFLARYMRSATAKRFDNPRDPYNYCSAEEALEEIGSAYPSLKDGEGEKYPSALLRWMGYIYRALAILKSIPSIRIYKQLKPERMRGLYESFHTFDPDYCVQRLAELLGWGHDGVRSDYEIYRQTRLSLGKKPSH